MDRDLEIADAAALGGLSSWRAAHPAKLGAPCANCATPLEGPYCHACGQLAEDFERTIWALLVESVENLFHADGRLLHTLPRLILRPASLTRDYLAGHRAAQMPPLRLFLVVILMFFFAGSLSEMIHPSSMRWAHRTDDGRPAQFTLMDEPPASSTAKPAARAAPALSPSTVRAINAWFGPRLAYISTHQREFATAMESWAHRIAIVFLPIATLLLGLLFVFQRRFFIFDHAIFSMHSLSFQGLLFTVVTLLKLAAPLGGLAGLLTVAAPVHLFFHLRGFYGTSVIGALVRMALLFLLSSIALALVYAGVFAVELNAVGSPA